VVRRPGLTVKVPLVALAVLTILAAGLNWPTAWGGAEIVTGFLQVALPEPLFAAGHAAGGEAWLEIVAVGVALLGIPVAWLLTVGAPDDVRQWLKASGVSAVRRFWLAGWAFDWFYDRLFVWPLVWMARANRGDFIDLFYRALAWLTGLFHQLFSLTQTGRLRWYATSVAIGALVILALVIWL